MREKASDKGVVQNTKRWHNALNHSLLGYQSVVITYLTITLFSQQIKLLNKNNLGFENANRLTSKKLLSNDRRGANLSLWVQKIRRMPDWNHALLSRIPSLRQRH